MNSNQIEQPDEEFFYPESELEIFEKIWDKGFVSPVSPEEIADIVQEIDLKKTNPDIGCVWGLILLFSEIQRELKLGDYL